MDITLYTNAVTTVIGLTAQQTPVTDAGDVYHKMQTTTFGS